MNSSQSRGAESMISIEQRMRQGGALSADLYKVYVNPLLDILSNSGLGSIFDFLHVFIGITTLFCGWSRYPSLLLKSTAMSTIVWISKGLFAINATSSAQVGAQQFIFPILPPSP
jgi:hypothetical protein